MVKFHFKVLASYHINIHKETQILYLSQVSNAIKRLINIKK